MKKFEITSPKYYELQKQLLTECKEYLTEVATAWKDKHFPLQTIYNEFNMDEAYACIVYDGGNHPEYASNACSQVESVYLYKEDGKLTLSIEDDGIYDISRVDAEDLINVTYAVDNAIDYMLEQLLQLLGIESTTENGVWTISRENWERLVDLAEGRDELDHYLDDECDDEEWLEEISECYYPLGFVTLIKRVAKIGDKQVTWEWK